MTGGFLHVKEISSQNQITNSDDQNLVSLTTNLAELQAHNLNRDVSPSSEIILSILRIY